MQFKDVEVAAPIPRGREDVSRFSREIPLGRGRKVRITVSSWEMSLGRKKLVWYSPPPGRYHWAREGRSQGGTIFSLEIPLARREESQVNAGGVRVV